MKRHGLFIILPALASAALLAGCWGSSKSTSLNVGGGGGSAATATAVGIDVCNNCHAGTAVGGDGIFSSWMASRHGNGNLTPAYPLEAACTACHDPQGDGASITGIAGITEARPVIGCEACHGGGSLHFGVGPIGGPRAGYYAVAATAGQSSQYNTCTSCHQVDNAYHGPDNALTIADTHVDNASTKALEGYNITRSSGTACVNCHNPHSADLAINRQWTESGHGDLSGDPWNHYDWKTRADCQQCHTTTGFVNFANSPSTYTPANNDFSHLTGLQLETLYCNGCHTNYYGGLRNPGPVTAPYTNAPHTYTNAAGSNVCLSCHTGRQSGGSIQASTASFDNVSFINSHYLTAGGTVFAVTGYHFADRDYSIPAGDLHDKIGLGTTGVAAVDTNYTNGPCVSCHFDSRDPNRLNPLTRLSDNTLSHTVSPLTRYADNDLALNPVCVNCHPTRGQGSNAGIAWLGDDNAAASLQGTTHRARYQAALEALRVELAQSGFHFNSSNPYFFNDTNGNGVLDPAEIDRSNGIKNWGDATTGKPNMGSAFNYNLLIHDPGGVAHNRRYTRRLIYDAIDWIDDGNMNYSVSATLNALDDAVVYKASAIAYLLAGSTGTAADRF